MDSRGSSACGGYYAEGELHLALGDKVFSKWVEQEAAVAVRAADLDDLFSCPFCGFSAVRERGCAEGQYTHARTGQGMLDLT